MRALFTPYGPIHSVTIPKAQSQAQDSQSESKTTASDPSSSATPSQSKPLARGFAFVWFLSQPDAARAIEKANGNSLYAGYAVDVLFANKSQIEGKRKIRKKMKGEDARVIAVDWALSKEKWNEAQQAALKSKKADEDGAEAMDIDEDKENNATLLDDDDEEQWVDEDLSESDAEESGSDEDADAMSLDGEGSRQGENPPQPDEGTTLFIRNVPFEAVDEDIKTLYAVLSSFTLIP